jgi:hypothetical protein
MCERIQLPNGGFAIICRGGHRSKIRRKCSANCGRWSSKLCDWPTGNGKTCDRPLCDECAVKGGREIDFCPSHSQERLKL